MKAVNLLPEGSQRGGSGGTPISFGPGFIVLGVLGLVLVLVTVYVLTSNKISDRRAKLANVQQQLAQTQAQARELGPFATYARLAQARVATVRQIASSRFDWHAALADLSRVMPAGVALQSLTATVAPGVSVPGGSSSGGSGATSTLRGDISAPAFEMHGCAGSHDAVAALMSRLRVMNGVQRVTLADSVKATGNSGTPATTSTTPSASAITACGPHPASFDLVLFFTPLPAGSVAPAGATASPTSPAAGAAAASGAAAPSSSPAQSGSTAPATPSTGSGAAPATATPAGSAAAPATSSGGAR